MTTLASYSPTLSSAQSTASWARSRPQRSQWIWEGVDEGGEDDDATSVASSQLPVSSQDAPSYPHDRRSPRPAGSGFGCKLDEAMLKLVDKIAEKTGMQDRLKSAVQETPKPRFAFCQSVGVELTFIDANLWSSFQREVFDLVTRYRDLQT